MEPLKLKTREPGTDAIECWDDDDDLQGIENLHLRNISSTTAGTFVSARSNHRESLQSRLSNKSDVEDEKDWQLHLPANDRDSTTSAIADAKSKGIPIPDNVPASALLGGTIRRLGGKKVRKAIGDDWGDDLELPRTEGLKLRINDGNEFPESLRQLSSTLAAAPVNTSSPTSAQSNLSFLERLQAVTKSHPSSATSPAFPENNDGAEEAPTIRVPKQRTSAVAPFFDQSPVKTNKVKPVEIFDDDLEFPEDGELKLSTRREAPKTPGSQLMDDSDADWADGSQGSFGTSHKSLRLSGRSNRSSSISARSPSVFSPSLSSCLTAESEDEGLDGLVLPDGPLHLQSKLSKQAADASPGETGEKKLAPSPMPRPKEDFFVGIEIGDGDVFDTGKLTLNRNIKHKSQRQSSPKRPAMTLTFTNKPIAPITRIPKPAGQDRVRSKLEPVLENAGQTQQLRRAKSRLDGHSAQSSVASLASTSGNTALPMPPLTPSRRGLVSRPSKETMRPETTTTTSQLLKSKRSLPILSGRDPASPSRIQPQQHSYQRPNSRTGKPMRPGAPFRPKTPVDRSESSFANARRQHAPAMPPSNMPPPNRPMSTRPSRTFHRPTSSENSNDSVSSSTRSMSRASNPYRQHSPVRRDVAPDSLAKAAATKRQITKPLRRRAFGDGNELDAFDDLPTSSTAESKYRRNPAVGKLPSSPALRKAFSHQNVLQQSSSRPQSTVPPPSPMKAENRPLPRFAQSTAASVARKQRAGAISPEALRRPPLPVVPEPPATLTATYRLQPPPKPNAAARHPTKRTPKPQQKPHLIKQLGFNAHESKSVKGMHYNPTLFRWEGNEHVLAPFDVPPSPKTIAPTPSSKPALIANVGSTKGVQVVGGMVFDPQRMCWLKLAPNSQQQQRSRAESGGVASLATEEEEDDPFAGFEELEDESKKRSGGGAAATGPIKDPGSDEEWIVGEEFDVGPEFVRRQRNEEVKWRRRMEGWGKVLATGPHFNERASWALRDLVVRDHERRAGL